MERVVKSEFTFGIKLITDISGENQIFYITFITTDEIIYKLTFDPVWDLRYSMENAATDRINGYSNVENMVSDIGIIENSEFINSYKNTTLEYTCGLDELKHYILTDKTDTVVDVLTVGKPTIEKVDKEDDINSLKQELNNLRKWKANSENQSAIQIDAED